MGEVFGNLLPLAVAIALGPIPILGIALMLQSRDPCKASVGFTIGWMLGLVIQVAALTALTVLTPEGDPDQPALWLGVLQAVLGSALLVMAVLKVKSWLTSELEPEVPSFLRKMSNIPASRSVGVGIAAVLVNVKHPVLVLPVGTFIVQADITVAQITLVILVFVMLSSLSVIGATIGYIISPVKVGDAVGVGYHWMVKNMDIVTAALLFFIGAKVLGNGIERIWG